MKLIVVSVKSICTLSHIYLQWLFALEICRGYFQWELSAPIWRGYLQEMFAMTFCRGNLQQLFAVAICCAYLPLVCFVYVNKPFFLCRGIFCLCKQSFFNWKKIFFIWEQIFLTEFMRTSFLTVFIFVIAVAVMGHRNTIIFLLYFT